MATRLLISGRVQGVGYREWLRGEATRRGLSGWCRNLRDGRVEAVVAGDAAGLVAACRVGPPAAAVAAVDVEDAADPDVAGFAVRPTA